ncbi:unnamed protein product [Ilex paraguariensis]|uniref:Aspartate/glutamate/uridylate kinase domain-containing protein n=1 Tax=Ilex paraguariensis TaxID=185542 RepID=A0ABC8SWX5_9AQUA
MDTRDVLVVNPTSSNQVDPDYSQTEKRLEKWFSENPSKTIIATGFIASTPQNIPTTLKRDGSDFSAAIMGALFRARRVTIWTDVDGVYSADPRKGVCSPFFWDIIESQPRKCQEEDPVAQTSKTLHLVSDIRPSSSNNNIKEPPSLSLPN